MVINSFSIADNLSIDLDLEQKLMSFLYNIQE